MAIQQDGFFFLGKSECVTQRTKSTGFPSQTVSRPEKEAMHRKYFFKKPTQREQLHFQRLLIAEMERQRWAIILFLEILDEDVTITLN
jgi:hypothetical protein